MHRLLRPGHARPPEHSLRLIERAREAERQRLARELHDDLGAALTCLKMDAFRLLRQNSLPAQAQQGLLRLAADIDGAIEIMRGVTAELHRPLDAGADPSAALRALFEGFLEHTGLDGDFSAALDQPLALSDEALLACYRIVQEALTNVARHAGATRVSARLTTLDDQLVVCVSDNGRGLPPEAAARPRGHGLAGMRERAGLVGAALHIESVPGRGTTIRLALPLHSSPARPPAASPALPPPEP